MVYRITVLYCHARRKEQNDLKGLPGLHGNAKGALVREPRAPAVDLTLCTYPSLRKRLILAEEEN